MTRPNPHRLPPPPPPPRNRRGFALLTVLWVITALGVVTGVSLGFARTGARASANRVLLARAAWAREACEEILHATYAEDPGVRMLDTTALGRSTWCRAELENAGAKVDVNHAAPELLRALIADDRLADALFEWLGHHGPLADVAQLELVSGFDSSRIARLAPVLTTRGTERVDLNAVPAAVLCALPGMTEEAVEVILRERPRIGGAEDLLARLSPPARMALLERYQEFSRAVTFTPSQLVLFVEGGVHGSTLRSRAWVTVVPVAGRLAVRRREAE